MAFFRKFTRSRGFAIQLMASFAFICLAIYGWGLTVREALSYLVALIVGLLIVIGLAVGCGYILSKLMNRKD